MIAVIMGVMLIACGSNSSDSSENNSDTTMVNNAGNSSNSQNNSSDTKAVTDVNSNSQQEQATVINNTEAEGNKILVAYFSATHTTEGVAKKIAENAGADIYEIKPAEPYTSADLNYNDKNSRSTKEMNDKSSRPAISGEVAAWDSYQTVYIGYPIWWGEAPRILDTFVEKYDFTGKTVIPFCTSASSGIGASDKNLAGLAKSGTWKSGHRFSGKESAGEVMSWVNAQ